LVALFALTAFQSCKKGDNDPSISLKSRDARITAKWKLTKIEGTDITLSSGITQTTAVSFDGSVRTVVTTITGFPIVIPPTTSKDTVAFDMTIEKKSKMSWTETFTTASPATVDAQSGTGTWQWVDSDKDKSFVTICGPNNGGSADLIKGGVYKIDRLASKELVLIVESSTNENGTNTTSTSYKYTFEAQ